jgi:hypothetical protein
MVCGTSVYRAGKEGFMKNGDSIRAMTDEELAEVFTDVGVRTLRLHRIPVAEPVIEQAKEDWLNWLKQEADNGQHDS